MDEAAIIQYITDTFDGSFTAAEWGDIFFLLQSRRQAAQRHR